MAIYLICNHKKSISATQLAKDMGVTLKTAWFLLHKIRRTFHSIHMEKLYGEVELDETFVGGKNKNRHANKKVKNSQGRSFKDKVPVLGMLQRGGNVICKVVKDTSVKSLTPPILKSIARTATLFTDEWCGYDLVRKLYTTKMVDHGKGLYVVGDAYTNSIESFWGNFCKRVVNAIYNWVSRKYMQRYFDEFCFRYNTRNVSNNVRFDMANREYKYPCNTKSDSRKMKTKKKNKKDRNYIPILDQPIEVLKKPMGQPVDFEKVITDVVRYNPKKKK